MAGKLVSWENPTEFDPLEVEEEEQETIDDFTLSDSGNAEHLHQLFGDQIRYCHKWKKWLVWNGKFWEKDEKGMLYTLSDKVVQSIYSQAATIKESEKRKQIAKFALKSESYINITNMIKLSRHKYGIPIDHSDLDRDPFLFNVGNGTIELKNIHIRGHNSGDLITKITPVNFMQAAHCPLWLQFLNEIMMGDQDKIDFLQRAVGYSLTGDTSELCLFILYGKVNPDRRSLRVNRPLGSYIIQIYF